MESGPTSALPTQPGTLDVFPKRRLEAGDIAVLVFYFLFVMAVGIWSTVKTKRDTVKGYFLAGGEMVWWPVGASLFASNIGSGHFVGLAGSGAATGISVAAYEFCGLFSVLMLSWVFLPVYIAGQVDMYAGAVFIQQSLNLNMYLATVGLLAITAVYTVAGGLAAVIYTDALQTVIMLVGALTLMGYSHCPAEPGRQEPVPRQGGLSAGGLPEGAAALHDGVPWDGQPRAFPRPGGLHSPGDLPGGLQQPDRLLQHRVPQTRAGNPAHGSSTIFTMDLWKHVRPRASEQELMIVGRVFVLLLVLVSILWIPVIQASQSGQLFIYIQAISSYLQPPVAVVFIMGCFWKRTNEKGAFAGLVLGLLLGVIRMILDFAYTEPQCGQPDNRPAVVKDIHYLYFAMILSAVTLTTLCAVSWFTEPPSEEMVSRLTWFTRHDPVVRKEPPAAPLPPALSQNEASGDTNTQLEGVEENADKTPQGAESPRRSRVVTAILWLCGMGGSGSDSGPAEPASKEDVVLVSLEEKPLVRTFLNLNLVVCACCAIFLWGYFA
ncbi:sodium/myo-inositol cotransporter 2 isoform X6 [Pteropus alecto]|uniref:sodium/myo-inositol cotransporter 2 isoform X6 n=1 Tax=Pteropus alecto TaxID=9402 RepID=UPI000D53B327|nr:sodium/myo-inositol cotransporter 2 isoform X6 [Pteropus alecto]